MLRGWMDVVKPEEEMELGGARGVNECRKGMFVGVSSRFAYR